MIKKALTGLNHYKISTVKIKVLKVHKPAKRLCLLTHLCRKKLNSHDTDM